MAKLPSYRNKSIDFLCKWIYWLLYDASLAFNELITYASAPTLPRDNFVESVGYIKPQGKQSFLNFFTTQLLATLNSQQLLLLTMQPRQTFKISFGPFLNTLFRLPLTIWPTFSSLVVFYCYFARSMTWNKSTK